MNKNHYMFFLGMVSFVHIIFSDTGKFRKWQNWRREKSTGIPSSLSDKLRPLYKALRKHGHVTLQSLKNARVSVQECQAACVAYSLLADKNVGNGKKTSEQLTIPQIFTVLLKQQENAGEFDYIPKP